MKCKMEKIAIHGVPRSGTSWLGEIINSSPSTIYRYQPLFSYALKGFLDEHSTPSQIEDFFSRLVTTKDDFMDQRKKRQEGLLPTFSKGRCSHVCYKEVRYHHILENIVKNFPQIRLVAIIRNPIAVLASWYSAPREFRRDLSWRLKDEWRFAKSKNRGLPEEFFGYEKWKEAARIFHRLKREMHDNVLIVRYEVLVAQPAETTEKIFSFCRLPVEEQTRKFLVDSTRCHNVADVYSVFRSGRNTAKPEDIIGSEIVESIVSDLQDDELNIYLNSV